MAILIKEGLLHANHDSCEVKMRKIRQW